MFSNIYFILCKFKKIGRVIGLTREVYNKWERRVPLTPSHVEQLVN